MNKNRDMELLKYRKWAEPMIEHLEQERTKWKRIAQLLAEALNNQVMVDDRTIEFQPFADKAVKALTEYEKACGS